MDKVNRSFVRVVPYARADVGNMERHNERKNEHYSNDDCFEPCRYEHPF